MDFVAREIFYLFWFSLMLGTFADITDPRPLNQAVVDQTPNVGITCNCSSNPDTIKWGFAPVGSPERIIKNGASFTDDNFGEHADGTTFTLIIKTASSSTAGTYTCSQGATTMSALLIVLLREVSCDFSPRDTSQVSCKSTLPLSCTADYIANTTLVTADFQWSADPATDDRLEDFGAPLSKSGNIATSTSMLNVTWPKDEGDNIPTYTCEATFNLFSSKSLPKGMAPQAPINHHRCQPFTSASSVPCIGADGVLKTAKPKTTTDDKVDQSEQGSSPRSAETNNLAIRVLGVAGVLLLAQLF